MARPKKTMIQQPLDQPRRLISERLDALGLDMATVSKQLGRNHAFLQQYVRYAVPSELKEDDRLGLAAILQVNQDLLRRPRQEPPIPHTRIGTLTNTTNGEVRPAPNIRLDGAQKRPQDVPVLGIVRGGAGGSFELNSGEPLDYVRRPVSIIGKGAVYALFIESDSMAPRYEPGEVVLVWSTRPPLIGRDVVVQLKPEIEGDNPRAYLKRLVRSNSRELVLKQFNPPKDMTVSMKDVLSVQMVLTRDEMV